MTGPRKESERKMKGHARKMKRYERKMKGHEKKIKGIWKDAKETKRLSAKAVLYCMMFFLKRMNSPTDRIIRLVLAGSLLKDVKGN